MAASSSSDMAGTNETEKYEVFISFRGADVRSDFLSHLLRAIKDKQIHAFVDSELERGKNITSSLLQIIEQSDLSIVIFSKDYPKSKWCLEELEKIHDLVKQGKQIAVPVFYKVNSSDVQSLEGNYAIKEQKWRDALVEISNLSGYSSRNYRTDALLIDDVVDKVSAILREIYPIISHNEGLFGIDSSINDVEALLNFVSTNDVRMVGIWGIGGIGKTTIASKVFHRCKKKFQGHCFVSNVREKLSTPDQLIRVRGEIIRELLRDRNMKIDSSNSVDYSICRRIKRTKFLLVLDDMHTSRDLKSLLEACGLSSSDSFCPGSRIIVTSRDSQVLRGDGKLKSDIYEVKKLKDTEALHLLCWHAFRQNKPWKGYEKLAEKVVRCTGGNPLALVVLGCELKEKATSLWEDALNKFNTNGSPEIQKILRISFDGLDSNEKNIFLDIACFFKGNRRDYVVNMLESFGFHAKIGVDQLIDKSLLREEKGGGVVIITMHDLVEQMGQDIVAKEKERNGHQSRLWTHEGIQDALTNDSGTNNVEAISLWTYNELKINPEAFIHMCKLRFLKFEHNPASSFICPMGLQFLPKSIKYLQWDRFPQSYWPSNYNSEKLVELHLQYSKLKEIIWIKPHVSLKVICLRGSESLIKILDLGMAPNLKDVDLSYCNSLVEVGPSLVKLNELKKLNVAGCKSLSHLPELPHRIEEMDLIGSGLRQLPSTIGRLSQLKQLSLSCCENLKNPTQLSLYLLPELPSSIEQLKLSCRGLKQLPSIIGHLTLLKHLSLASCMELESLPSSICNMTSLKGLHLSECRNLRKLPEDFGNLKSLEKLVAENSGLIELPRSIKYLKKLTKLSVEGCTSLSHLPELPSSITKLRLMESGLKLLPSTVGHLTHIKALSLESCENLESLPDEFGNLKSLKVLDASYSGLTKLPSTIGHLTGLIHLYLESCEKLESLPSSICNLTSLERLFLSNCRNLRNLPEGFGNLKSLKELHANQSGLTELPPSIRDLNKLRKLDLSDCKDLRSVPSLPSNHCISLLTEVQSSNVEQCYLSKLLHNNPTQIHKFCVDGERLPKWMTYRNNCGASISLDSQTDGHFITLVFGVVISTSSEEGYRAPVATIKYKNSEETYKCYGLPRAEIRAGASYLYLWNWNCDTDCKFVKDVSFEFEFHSSGRGREEINICGVHPILPDKNSRKRSHPDDDEDQEMIDFSFSDYDESDGF